MTIVNRVSRLIKADIHGLMDKVEEPMLMLKHALREMDELISSEETKCKNLERNLTQIDEQDRRLKNMFDASEKQLRMCFEEKNQELAKKLVRKKLEIERQFRVNGERRDEIKQQIEYIKERLEEWRARRNEIVSQMQILDIQSEDKSNVVGIDGPISEDDVDIAYLEELKRFESGEYENEVSNG